MPSHTSIELKYLIYDALVCCNFILYGEQNNNTTISGCDGAKVVLTSQAYIVTVILRHEDALRRLNSDGTTCPPTLMIIH
jgi:hypothetical protein